MTPSDQMHHRPGESYLVDQPGVFYGQWRVDCSCKAYSAYDHCAERAEQAARKHADGTAPPRIVTHELCGPYWYLNGRWRAWCRCWTSSPGYMTDFCVTAAEAERLVLEHIERAESAGRAA